MFLSVVLLIYLDGFGVSFHFGDVGHRDTCLLLDIETTQLGVKSMESIMWHYTC